MNIIFFFFLYEGGHCVSKRVKEQEINNHGTSSKEGNRNVANIKN